MIHHDGNLVHRDGALLHNHSNFLHHDQTYEQNLRSILHDLQLEPQIMQ